MINLVYTNPATLNAGQTQVDVTAIVNDDIDINDVWAAAIDATGMGVASVRLQRLPESMPPQYTFRGVMVIPLTVGDGTYPVSVTAKDAKTSVTNDTTKFIVARGMPPTPPRPTPTPTQPDENDKCCCKVSLNITAGPVNIYVCGRDSKIESNVPA